MKKTKLDKLLDSIAIGIVAAVLYIASALLRAIEYIVPIGIALLLLKLVGIL